MDEMTLTLNNPLTEEQRNDITDVDFENTDKIWFTTKHQKTVEFVKRKKGKWISLDDFRGKYNEFGYKCSECKEQSDYEENFCPNCGADMRGEKE